jgi:hypothetical protein
LTMKTIWRDRAARLMTRWRWALGAAAPRHRSKALIWRVNGVALQEADAAKAMIEVNVF